MKKKSKVGAGARTLTLYLYSNDLRCRLRATAAHKPASAARLAPQNGDRLHRRYDEQLRLLIRILFDSPLRWCYSNELIAPSSTDDTALWNPA
ncbi:MAG: hypothetical protein ACXV5H_04070 [Halobacteriota archaeon]